MGTKRPRDLDSELYHSNDRLIKRRRIMPSTVKSHLPPRREQKTESVVNFPTLPINTDDVRARIRYHVKRCNRINSSNPERYNLNENPTISINELERMCERSMKEREEHLRMEYEKALSCRLLELYESFLKFNSDMVVRGPWTEIASYVS